MHLLVARYLLMVGSAATSTVFPLIYSASTTHSPGGAVSPSKKYEISQISEVWVTKSENSQNKLISEKESKKELERKVYPAELSKGIQNAEIQANQEVQTENLTLNSNEEDKYHSFFKHFWEILRRTLWVDNINGIPWIHLVRGVIPLNKSQELRHYLLKQRDEVQQTATIEVKFGSDSVKKLRDWGPRHASSVTTPIRKGMEELFLKFIDPDWKINRELFNNKLFVGKLPEVSLHHISTSAGAQSTQTIRFTRIYEGKTYYLDVVFNTKKGENRLYIPVIKSVSKYYQANGEEGSSKNFIGGTITTLTNEFDREFATMFDNLNRDSSNFYKQITIVGECLGRYSNCGGIFPMEKAYVLPLNFKTQGSSSANHPLADIYWTFKEKWKANQLKVPFGLDNKSRS